MASFLSNTKDRLTLEMKRRRLRKDPGPGTLSELVQACIRLGRLKEACQVAEKGIRQFSDSVIVQEIHRIALRERAKQEMQEAKAEVQSNPTPTAFLRLARNAIQVLDGSTAVEALTECISRFPTCAPAHSALAEIYERRYSRDLLAVDGNRVLDLLMRSCKLDPTDMPSQLRLARFYAKVGVYALARRTAEALVARDGRSEHARNLLAMLPESRKLESKEEIAETLQRIEEQGKLPRDRQDATRMRREVSRLCHGLPKVREKVGARRAVVVDVNGDAWDEQGTIGVDALVSISAHLSRSANITTRRSDLGPLRGATLESNSGSLVLRRGYRCTVGALLPNGATIRGSQEALSRLLAGAAGPAGRGDS